MPDLISKCEVCQRDGREDRQFPAWAYVGSDLHRVSAHRARASLFKFGIHNVSPSAL